MRMIISKALGTYKMKDAVIYLTSIALIIENTSAAPQYQFRITIPLKEIKQVTTKNNMLLISKVDGGTINLIFYKRSKLEIFYNYLSNNDTSALYDDTKCLFCGTLLQGEYCTSCGHKRVEFAQEQEASPQKYMCWRCCAEFESKVDFCSECGAKQDRNKVLARIEAEINKSNVCDVCPRCGSHNIKLYRKGYNYKVGFWGSIFGVKGAGYAGGFDANNTCCRCMDCGKDWETNYDYRLIK
jgi:hypothetical protein